MPKKKFPGMSLHCFVNKGIFYPNKKHPKLPSRTP
jgi:hypothetical protein